MSPTANTTARPEFDCREQEVYLNLWRTFDRLRALEDALFARYALTAQQYNALRLLRAAQPGSLRTLEIASLLISRAPDITRLLDKLADRKLIARERLLENRRVVEVQITPAGLQLLDELAGPIQECHQEQLGHLSAIQMTQLIRLLKTARAPHEAPESDAEPES